MSMVWNGGGGCVIQILFAIFNVPGEKSDFPCVNLCWGPLSFGCYDFNTQGIFGILSGGLKLLWFDGLTHIKSCQNAFLLN